MYRFRNSNMDDQEVEILLEDEHPIGFFYFDICYGSYVFRSSRYGLIVLSETLIAEAKRVLLEKLDISST